MQELYLYSPNSTRLRPRRNLSRYVRKIDYSLSHIIIIGLKQMVIIGVYYTKFSVLITHYNINKCILINLQPSLQHTINLNSLIYYTAQLNAINNRASFL